MKMPLFPAGAGPSARRVSRGGEEYRSVPKRGGGEDAPRRADGGEAYAQRDAERGPRVRGYGLEEAADIEGLAAAGEEHVLAGG